MSGARAGGQGHRSGFVGLVGRPNVGKSTMLNYFVGEKVAITSPTPQTTRQRILGVLTREDAQVAFLDSPGLHQPKHPLGRYMVESAKAVIEEADVLVAVIDGRAGLKDADRVVFDRVRETTRPALLAINKVDVARKPRLLPLIEACASTGAFQECIPVSALCGTQMEILLDRIIANLPEGPPWYESAQTTDQPLTQRMAELIREQLVLATREEVPHALGVAIESVEERARVTAIHAVIVVERPGQKAIVIGRQGAQLKSVGQAARRQLERLVGRKVHLELWVKVRSEWRSDDRILRDLGYSGGT